MIEKCEVTTPEKGAGEVSDQTSEENESMSDEETADTVEQELEELNSHLDNLDSVLDNLEKKNDDIHAQLVELLEANRQVKMLFQDGTSQNINQSKE